MNGARPVVVARTVPSILQSNVAVGNAFSVSDDVFRDAFQLILKQLDDVLLEDWVEPVWKGKKSKAVSGSKEFLIVDAKF